MVRAQKLLTYSSSLQQDQWMLLKFLYLLKRTSFYEQVGWLLLFSVAYPISKCHRVWGVNTERDND